MHTVSLKVEHLSCAYGAKTVLEDVTLSFEPGKLYGILGPNGSGKTTPPLRPAETAVRYGPFRR